MFRLVTVLMCVLFTPPYFYSHHIYTTQTLYLTINKGLKEHLEAWLLSCVDICEQNAQSNKSKK